MDVNKLERKIAQNVAINLESRIRMHLDSDKSIIDMNQRINKYKVGVVDLVKKIQVFI